MSDATIDPIDDYVASSETFPDTTYYADTPQERTEEEHKEAAVVAASYPIMADVEQWFSEQIEATDSRRNIAAYAVAHNYDLERCAMAFDIVRELLEAKASEFTQYRREP